MREAITGDVNTRPAISTRGQPPLAPHRSSRRHSLRVPVAGRAQRARLPAIGASDRQLQEWIKVTDLSSFTVGVYIEALGILFLLPFVAWLCTTLRSATGFRPWTAVLTLAAGAGYVVLSLPINESWVGILEQGKRGLDVRVAQTLVSTGQAWFNMSNMMLGLFLIAAGLAILQRGQYGAGPAGQRSRLEQSGWCRGWVLWPASLFFRGCWAWAPTTPFGLSIRTRRRQPTRSSRLDPSTEPPV